MKNNRELSDMQFELAFAHAQLDPESFTHLAHLRLAWIHINKYGLETAIQNIRQQLKGYVIKLGEENKYNETLTVAAINAVYHFMLKSDVHTFKAFISQNEVLIYNFKELLLSHYSINILESEIASKKYIEPDLVPF